MHCALLQGSREGTGGQSNSFLRQPRAEFGLGLARTGAAPLLSSPLGLSSSQTVYIFQKYVSMDLERTSFKDLITVVSHMIDNEK